MNGALIYGRFCRDRGAADLMGRSYRRRVGDHLVGRFCWQVPSPTAGWPISDSSGFQIAGHCLATDAGLSLDSAQRPSQSP